MIFLPWDAFLWSCTADGRCSPDSDCCNTWCPTSLACHVFSLCPSRSRHWQQVCVIYRYACTLRGRCACECISPCICAHVLMYLSCSAAACLLYVFCREKHVASAAFSTPAPCRPCMRADHSKRGQKCPLMHRWGRVSSRCPGCMGAPVPGNRRILELSNRLFTSEPSFSVAFLRAFPRSQTSYHVSPGHMLGFHRRCPCGHIAHSSSTKSKCRGV